MLNNGSMHTCVIHCHLRDAFRTLFSCLACWSSKTLLPDYIQPIEITLVVYIYGSLLSTPVHTFKTQPLVITPWWGSSHMTDGNMLIPTWNKYEKGEKNWCQGNTELWLLMTDLLSSVSSSWCACFSFSLSSRVFCSEAIVFSFSWSRWDRLAAVLPFREYIATS